MLYHVYRITFTGYDQDEPVFLISKRHSDEIIAKTPTVSKAIDLINTWEKQLDIFTPAEERYAPKNIGRITESAAREAAFERVAGPDLPKR